MATTGQLRKLLNGPGVIRSLGAHDVFTARLVEAAGLETVFLGGFGTSASLLGLPDVGFITLTEMADAVRRMALRVSHPRGGRRRHRPRRPAQRRPHRARVRARRAAGVLLEDQVTPKRCGHFAGKQLIPADDMVLKLKAALSARTDPDFVIVARTDARAVEGIDGAIERANRYGAAGADVCFIEAPQSRRRAGADPAGGALPAAGEHAHRRRRRRSCPSRSWADSATRSWCVPSRRCWWPARRCSA